MSPGLRDERGTSLIELIVAVTILMLGVVAVATNMTSTMRRTTHSGIRGSSSELADAKLEELRAAAMAQGVDPAPVAMGGSTTADVAGHFDVVTDAQGRDFRRRWSVTDGPVVDAAGKHTRVVTVRVAPSTGYPVDAVERTTLVAFLK
jgi:Tfp pilus assembly protein PilV